MSEKSYYAEDVVVTSEDTVKGILTNEVMEQLLLAANCYWETLNYLENGKDARWNGLPPNKTCLMMAPYSLPESVAKNLLEEYKRYLFGSKREKRSVYSRNTYYIPRLQWDERDIMLQSNGKRVLMYATCPQRFKTETHLSVPVETDASLFSPVKVTFEYDREAKTIKFVVYWKERGREQPYIMSE
jgi:hypothetical protein